MKKVTKMMMVLISLGLWCSVSVADFATGFESSEGFTDGATIVGVDNWTLLFGNDGRSKSVSDTPPGAKVGDMYAKVFGWNGTSGGAERVFSESERIGTGRNDIWEAQASVWMAAGSTAEAGVGLIYFAGQNQWGTDAAVVGFKGGSFAYYHGGGLQTIGSVVANTWYKFDVVMHCNGQGVTDTYDLTISDSQGTVLVDLQDLYWRASGSVDYIGRVKLLSERYGNDSEPTRGNVYYDAITVIPEPMTIGLMFIGLVVGLLRRR